MTAQQPPAVWWSPSWGLLEAVTIGAGTFHEHGRAEDALRQLPADAVRLVPATAPVKDRRCCPEAPTTFCLLVCARCGRDTQTGAEAEYPREERGDGESTRVVRSLRSTAKAAGAKP